jgi:hypothetical protein
VCRLLNIPAYGQLQSLSSAPSGTAFATFTSLAGRVLVLQAHWQLSGPEATLQPALPSIAVRLGQAVPQAADEGSSSPALLGTFVGSGLYPPSSLSGKLQAFQVPAVGGDSSATAALACGKRCTYVALGKLKPSPVTVVAYSFVTFDRAVSVSFEIQRGKWARWHSGSQSVHVVSKSGEGVVQLQQPFQVRVTHADRSAGVLAQARPHDSTGSVLQPTGTGMHQLTMPNCSLPACLLLCSCMPETLCVGAAATTCLASSQAAPCREATAAAQTHSRSSAHSCCSTGHEWMPCVAALLHWTVMCCWVSTCAAQRQRTS